MSRLAVILSVLMWSAHAAGEVRLMPRQAAILDPGQDQIWGTYIIAVENSGNEPAEFSTPLTLPKETVDFKAQAGITDANLLPMPGGGIQISATFPPGQTLIAIGFLVPAHLGEVKLHFIPRGEVSDLSVMAPLGVLTITSPDLSQAPTPAKFGDRLLEALISNGTLTPEKSYEVLVSGIPEGRTRLWWIGGSVGFGLFFVLILIRLQHKRRHL